MLFNSSCPLFFVTGHIYGPKATVTPDRTISGSYTIGCDWTKVRPIGNVCYRDRSLRVVGRAITNYWRISMARAIVGNRATSGSDQRPMYDQS